MAAMIEQEFERCVSEGRIQAFGRGPMLVKRQLDIAAEDLAIANEGLTHQRWKWSTIQAYYSMFHTARAFLYAKSFRERHHRCLRIAIAHLYAMEGDNFHQLVDEFQLAKELRENADYADSFSETSARKLVVSAERFLHIARQIISPLKSKG